MNDTLIVALGGIVVSVLAYFAGQQRADLRHDRERADKDEREQREQHRTLAGKLVDEYVDMVRRHYADGPYALAKLGLDALGSDALIREAITEMETRSGSDPWSGHGRNVQSVDLVVFFQIVRERRIDFAKVTVEEVVGLVEKAGDGGGA